MSHELAEAFRLARRLRERGRMLKTVTRAIAAVMEAVKVAIK